MDSDGRDNKSRNLCVDGLYGSDLRGTDDAPGTKDELLRQEDSQTEKIFFLDARAPGQHRLMRMLNHNGVTHGCPSVQGNMQMGTWSGLCSVLPSALQHIIRAERVARFACYFSKTQRYWLRTCNKSEKYVSYGRNCVSDRKSVV